MTSGQHTAVEDSVVLVNGLGEPIGQHPRATVHTAATPLHLAFSCYLLNVRGEVLLTRRSLAKRTWPGVWTNSCCGHPRVGEPLADAIRRRVVEELGVQVSDPVCVLPDFAYRAEDASGMVENEVCPVYTAELLHPNARLTPNPSEVIDWSWLAWGDLVTAVTAAPMVFSPWSVRQVEQLRGTLA